VKSSANPHHFLADFLNEKVILNALSVLMLAFITKSG